MKKKISIPKVYLLLLGAGACNLLVGIPVLYTLFGRSHALSFSIGVFANTTNFILLYSITRKMIQDSISKPRKGLISLIVVKYLILVGVFVGSLFYLKLPPISLVVGIIVNFPIVLGVLWYQSTD